MVIEELADAGGSRMVGFVESYQKIRKWQGDFTCGMGRNDPQPTGWRLWTGTVSSWCSDGSGHCQDVKACGTARCSWSPCWYGIYDSHEQSLTLQFLWDLQGVNRNNLFTVKDSKRGHFKTTHKILAKVRTPSITSNHQPFHWRPAWRSIMSCCITQVRYEP